jgi:hypothetical protein
MSQNKFFFSLKHFAAKVPRGGTIEELEKDGDPIALPAPNCFSTPSTGTLRIQLQYQNC